MINSKDGVHKNHKIKMKIKKFDRFISEAVIDVKEVKPYGGLYSDPNGQKYYKDDKGTIYTQVDRGKEMVWHVCTKEGEPDYPTHSEIRIVDGVDEGLKRDRKLHSNIIEAWTTAPNMAMNEKKVEHDIRLFIDFLTDNEVRGNELLTFKNLLKKMSDGIKA